MTRPRIDADPRAIEATEQQRAAAKTMRKTLEPDSWSRLRVHARIFGTDAVTKHRAPYADARPHTIAENQARTAKHARTEIEVLRSLTPAEAVERIGPTRAAAHAAREVAERERRLRATAHSRDRGPYRGPAPGG